MSTDETTPEIATESPEAPETETTENEVVWDDLQGALESIGVLSLATDDGEYVPLVMLSGVQKLLGEGVYRAQDLELLAESFRAHIERAKLLAVVAQSCDKVGIPREQSTQMVDDLLIRDRDRKATDNLLALARLRF